MVTFHVGARMVYTLFEMTERSGLPWKFEDDMTFFVVIKKIVQTRLLPCTKVVPPGRGGQRKYTQ